MPTVKRLQFANGTDVTMPADLTLESSTNKLETYADDAAYVTANGPANNGDIYINSTTKTARIYVGGQWWSCLIKEDAIVVDNSFALVDNGDSTKKAQFDVSNVAAGTTKTYAVPAISTSSDVLVTKDATQELKNKTIDGNLNTLTNLDFGTLSGEVNPQNGGTGISNPAGATLTRTGAFDLNITCTDETDVTMPVSGTLATLGDITTTQITGTLAPAKGGLGTNASAFNGVVKADGAGNFSASSVTNTDVSATAAIARSKVASGTASHVVINDGTGVLSSEATLAKARGGSGQDNTNITFPATGTLVTQSATENLSNKTLVEPVIDNFATFNLEGTPTAAAANTVRVYAKGDNKLYKMDSTGAEAAIGSGGGAAGVNYLADWYDATKPIGTMSTSAPNGNILVANLPPPTNYSAWYADATSGTSAISSSANTGLRGSYNYLTALSGASTSGATFVQTAAFNVDASDLGKPVTISFDLSGVTTADDWDIVVARYTTSSTLATFAELIPVAGTVSSTTGTPGAQLPTGTTQFKGFFIAGSTASDVYALRFRRRAGSTQIRIDSLTVGPQSLAQGAIVTAWQSYTPTFESFGTVSNVFAYWRRNGDSIEVNGSCVVGTVTAIASTISLPIGLNLDSNKLVGTQSNILGFAYRANTTATPIPGATRGPTVLIDAKTTSTTKIYISTSSDTNSGGLFAAVLGTNLLSNGDSFSFNFKAPISQWSSGTTTLADRAVEEYASNSGSSTTTDTTSSFFAYGPEGSNIRAFSPGATGVVIKRCRFNSSIQSTDKLSIEFNDGNGWNSSNLGNFFSDSTGANFFGTQVRPVSGSLTDVDVLFYSKYDGATAWSSITSYKWRVRKVSGGAAVGFPVSARNIIGDTSGTAVPSGYVGEYFALTMPSNTTITTSDTTLISQSLSPGIWMLTGGMTADGSNNIVYCGFYQGVIGSGSIIGAVNGATANVRAFVGCQTIVRLTSTTTMVLYGATATGSATASGNRCFMNAVRIA